jgi:hypothetical protein
MHSLWERMLSRWLGQPVRPGPGENSDPSGFVAADAAAEALAFAVRREPAASVSPPPPAALAQDHRAPALDRLRAARTDK